MIDIGAQRAALSGNISAGGDLRVVTTGPDSGGAALRLAGATTAAGEDLLLDATGAGSVQAAGNLTAGRDIAIAAAASGVALASATAGDDIAIRCGPGG